MTNIKRILEAASGGATATDYQLMSWGKGTDGALGLGNTTNYSSPKTVGSADTWTQLSTSQYGAKNSVGVIKNGALFTWGDNTDGNLGLGNTTSYSSPKQVGSLTDWAEVSMGGEHCLAVKKNGTLWAWGNGTSFGALGLGNTSDYSSPKQVGSLTNWSKVAASPTLSRSAAIKTDGTLWTWGNGATGVTGHGDITNRSSPVQVGSLTNWAEIAVSGQHMVAVKTDGTLWAWGNGGAGRLGFGNTTSYSSPKQVGALTNWATPAVSNYFSGCVKTDYTLWTWGSGSYGKLGHGNTTSYSSPKQVGALTNWLQMSMGGMHSVCVKTDGTLWSWGNNGGGKLGLGNTTHYSSPKQIGSLTSWKAVSCLGYGGNLAFYEP